MKIKKIIFFNNLSILIKRILDGRGRRETKSDLSWNDFSDLQNASNQVILNVVSFLI